MFIIPGAKLANPVDLSTAFQQAITSECGPDIALTIQPAAKAMNQLRTILSEPPDTERTRQKISQYLASLHYLLHVRPSIITTSSQQIEWVNAFDAQSIMISNDLRLDRISALFNLGVCAARIARTYYQRRRHDPNALKAAANSFKLAAGYFRAARDESLPDGIRTATVDLFPASLHALECAMLGNAQQVYYIYAKTGASPPNILARFAAGVRDYYITAAEFCNDHDIKSTVVNANVGLPCSALSAYFDIIVNETMADSDQKLGEHASALTRFEHAQETGNNAAKLLQQWGQTALAEVNNLRTTFDEELNKIRTQVEEKKENADTMNRTVLFLAKAEYVTPIQPHQSLTPADVGQGFGDEIADDILRVFADLPEPLSQDSKQNDVTSRYTEMETSHVTDKVASITAMTTTLHERITQIELDVESANAMIETERKNTVHVNHNSLAEEQKAVDAILYVQVQGGLTSLRAKQETISGIAASAKSQIQSIELLLQQEEAEDRELRGRIYVQRPVSQVRAQEYHTSLARIKGKLVKAANADLILERDINTHSASFRDLLDLNLNGFVPPSAKTSMSESDRLQAEYQGLLKNVHPEIHNAKEKLEDIQQLTKQFEQKKAEDDPATITQNIKPGNSEIDELTDLLSRQYIDLDKNEASTRSEVQRLCTSLMDWGKKLRQLRPATNTANDDQNMMNLIYRNQASAEKYKEIMHHFEQGEDFYRKEKVNIDNLRNDVDGFVAARRTEARDLENFAHQAQGRQSYQQNPNQGQANNYYYPPGNPPPPTGGNPYQPGGNNYSRYY